MVNEEKKRAWHRREKRKEIIQNDLERFGSGILASDEMRSAFQQTHHTRSTLGEHTRRVAEKSLAICHALEKLRIHTDIPAVVAGSLCHDLGMLDRDAKYDSEQTCSRQHPADSVDVARRLVDDLPDKAEDIIRHHMWPTAGSEAPRSLEGVIVSAADKVAAVEDFLRGSRVKPSDLKTTIRTISKRSFGPRRKKKKM